MASFLYRVGRFSARHAKSVLVTWLVILLAAAGSFLLFGGALSSAVTMPGTATQKVADELSARFPAVSGGSGNVIFVTKDGSAFTDTQKSQIADLLGKSVEFDHVKGAVNPFETAAQLAAQQAQIDAGLESLAAAREQQGDSAELSAQEAGLQQGVALLNLTSGIKQISDDSSAAVAVIQFDVEPNELPADVKDGLTALFEDASIDGVEAIVSGDIATAIPALFGVGEATGLVVAGVVLIVMLGTLIGAGLPLLNALMGVGVGVMAAMALSGAVDMLSLTPILGVMLGLAVGIDYSLFIINRHRNQLRSGMDMHESIGLANGTSGNAVVFAGSTVLVALLALNVVGIPFLGLMGTVGAICILTAVLVAVTLTPALLSLVGMRILPKKAHTQLKQEASSNATAAQQSSPASATSTQPGEGQIVSAATGQVVDAPMSMRRAVTTTVAVIAALLVVAIPALDMRLGLSTSASEPADSAAYRSYTITNEKFGPGVNGALIVVAELATPVTEQTLVSEQVRIGTILSSQANVSAIAPVGASEDNELLAFQVVPTNGPTDKTTETLVGDLRGLTIDGVTSVGVAGSASGNIDISEKLNAALPIYLLLVVGLSLVILIFVFRSILVPVTATLGFILSLFATFGGLTAIFQWGWLASLFGINEPGPILSFLPVIVVGILFGLAMDYQLFLVSGMREAYAHGDHARVAVRHGVAAGKSVVIAAALIMVSVFSGFIFAESGMIKSIGFALAFGVLVDAILVRLLLIPAVMHLLGESAWWIPKWLDRILPDVDVEGASLERAHHVPVASEAHDSDDELVGADL